MRLPRTAEKPFPILIADNSNKLRSIDSTRLSVAPPSSYLIVVDEGLGPAPEVERVVSGPDVDDVLGLGPADGQDVLAVAEDLGVLVELGVYAVPFPPDAIDPLRLSVGLSGGGRWWWLEEEGGSMEGCGVGERARHFQRERERSGG